MNPADVLLPLTSIDEETHHLIEGYEIPVHRFDHARRLIRPGRSFSAVARDERGPRRQGIVWVECESRAQVSLLAKLPVVPSVIFRHGSRVARTAVWWLDVPLEARLRPGSEWTWGEEANRRLAHALGAPKKHCGADHCFVVGEVERAEPVRVPVASVVAGLAAAPVARSWREEVAA